MLSFYNFDRSLGVDCSEFFIVVVFFCFRFIVFSRFSFFCRGDAGLTTVNQP